MPAGAIPERPNRPLVVKCGYDNSVRRVTFPSAATCRLESLRSRVSECFHLSASPFFLTYTDDDGEEFSIHTESDFTEAISYFVSGDDEANVSTYSGASGPGPSRLAPLPLSTQKITIRLEVVVEYDGPSLSDTSSISSFSTGRESRASRESGSHAGTSAYGSAWRSSGYSESVHASVGMGSIGGRRNGSLVNHEDASDNPYDAEEGETEYGESGTRHQGAFVDSMEDLSLSGSRQDVHGSFEDATSMTRRRSDRSRATPSAHSTSRQIPPPGHTIDDEPISVRPLTGPDSTPAPSLLTSSELGSRWLREQSKLATTRRLGPGLAGSSRRYDSDEDSIGSDEESLGDLALVRDARGKFYYSYQTNDDISLSSATGSDYDTDDFAGPGRRPTSFSASASTISPPRTPSDHTAHEIPRLVEPAGPPVLAPDCSACGIRLDYMRYVCQTCGDGEMWKENAPGKATFVPPRVPSESSTSEGSEETEWVAQRSNGSETVYGEQSRSRSGSMSTSASRGSGSREGPGSPRLIHQEHHEQLDGAAGAMDRPQRSGSLPRGYELCVGCIEVHGIAHAKAAAKEARKLGGAEVSRRRRQGELRHTFREKIWSVQGWVDVEYSEDSSCTICCTLLINNRYKCVSCPKFDLCRSCYQKVEEIHPAHAFLSLPDQELPPVGTSGAQTGRARDIVERRPMRHPGAFCHNCLQDIVGPRFHCAVCPSWDLCIQCEGLAGVGEGSGHKADHIMMKIPVPLATNEVEAVSRRARDRWFHQDSNTVAAAVSSPRPPSSSRSSSPTNETVYAGGTNRANGSSPIPPAHVVNITTRDALDHGVRCNCCNEWIMGRRYQCANCLSEPEAYNLCTICELRSYRVHDPRHVFFKFDRPVHIPLSSPRALLPILYRSRVGEVPAGAVINPRDPTAYLKHVLHRETLCDIHSNQIRGAWLRCCHCAAGFDICQEAEQIADHDATHVFVVFKARVDMGAFRQLADLASTQSKPLLSRQVYLD